MANSGPAAVFGLGTEHGYGGTAQVILTALENRQHHREVAKMLVHARSAWCGLEKAGRSSWAVPASASRCPASSFGGDMGPRHSESSSRAHELRLFQPEGATKVRFVGAPVALIEASLCLAVARSRSPDVERWLYRSGRPKRLVAMLNRW